MQTSKTIPQAAESRVSIAAPIAVRSPDPDAGAHPGSPVTSRSFRPAPGFLAGGRPYRYFASQAWTSCHQTTRFAGFKIQCPSSGNQT